MKAINANSYKQSMKAVGGAPRGKRALWTLNIQVGSQSVSPLMWALETGSLESARAIIVDLLTIRVGRDRYYDGMDTTFERHPETLKTLCGEARGLLSIMFDRLTWRSRTTENGLRRVNYYVKHFIVGEHGGFSPATEWLTDKTEPRIVCHPVVALVTERLWCSSSTWSSSPQGSPPSPWVRASSFRGRPLPHRSGLLRCGFRLSGDHLEAR